MKKNLFLYIVAFAALMVVSCTSEVLPVSEQPFKNGETGLIMRVSSTSPTKAIPAPAEEDLNEDVLKQFYYFLYADDPSAEGNEDVVPVFAGKWTAPKGETVTGTGTEEKIVLDKLTDIKVSDTKYAGYVYVIANYTDEEALAAWDNIIAASAPDYSTLTWDYFQNLPLPATFDSYQIVGGDEIMNEKQDEGHRFKAQDSFIMASAPTYFEVTKGTAGSIDAPLERLAVKVNIEIHMAKWYVQRNNGQYKNTWYSDPERIQVYLNYAAKTGKMSGNPITYISTGEGANPGDFFTYRRFAFLSNWTKNGDDIIFPDGSYAEKDPFRWIYKEEPAAVQPETDGQYYTSDEDLAGKIVESGGEIVYHEYTRPAYKITGTPFYSYPYDFSTNSNYAPFFKIIVEWTGYNESAGTIATDTEEGTKNVPEVIAREFYYKISMPDGLFRNYTPKIFQANHSYTIILNLSTLGSEADETAIDVSSDTYFVTNWSDPSTPDIPNINAGRYLSIKSATTEEVDGEEIPVFYLYGKKLELPMTTSHEVEIADYTATYENFASLPPQEEELTLSETTSAGAYFMLYQQDIHTLNLEHDLETDIDDMEAYDIVPITYTFTVQHINNPSFSQKVRVIQYPSIYIKEMDGGNAFIDGFFQFLDKAPEGYNNPIRVTSPRSGYRSASFTGTTYSYGGTYSGRINGLSAISGWTPILTPYGCLTYDNKTQTSTTLITVSTFSEESDHYQPRDQDPVYYYTISDPRVDNNWGNNHLIPYLTGQSASSGNNITLSRSEWTDEDKIKVGSGIISSNGKNLSPIAPAFLISSRWGRGGGSSYNGSDQMPRNLQQAEQRCATYQEAGYPAGRWRLPTEAEVYFVYQLQQNRLLGNPDNGLFTAGGYGYMASSGRTFGYQSHTYFENRTNTQVSFRCVYDYWYWGEKDRNVYKYTPKP